MWKRGGSTSSALDRAKAQLSGRRITNPATSKDRRDEESSATFASPVKQTRFQDLSDVSSQSQTENHNLVKSFSMGGGSRFLKKTSKDTTGDRLSSAHTENPAGTDEFKYTPQRSSQSAALSRLALIENHIRNHADSNTNHTETQETRLSVQSSSDLSMTGSRFLKKKTTAVPEEEKISERKPDVNERKERKFSIDSDEHDMQRLLGDSFSLSEASLQNVIRKRSPQPVKKFYKSSEKSTIPSPTPERHKERILSPSPRRPESRMVHFTERSVSDHSEIRSLDDLFPVAAAPDSDDTLSERSQASDDFKLNVMTLDDLAPVSFEPAEISQEKKETQAKKEDRNKKSSINISKVGSPPPPEDVNANYESDFESEIQSESTPNASEISERLSDEDKDASLASEDQYKSQDDDYDDRTSSRSSISSSPHSNSFSKSSLSNATVTRGPSPEANVKEAAVQTQADGLSYMWTSGMAGVHPSLGMAYVDPIPIASHTVSSEALESLTSYNPALSALNHMLRQQLALTRAFIDSTRRHHTAALEALGPADYKYTTLQDTKDFIRANRPPKMSIEDALEEVLQEMRDYHCV